MRYLAIDLGSTFLKGSVLDLDRPCFGPTQREPMPQPTTEAGAPFFEISPDALCDAVIFLMDPAAGAGAGCRGIDDVLADARDGAGECPWRTEE